MAFDFPDVPAVDEVVTFGDTSYKWNLEKWMRQPKGATNVAVIHDGTLQGDGTAAFPLSIANSVVDATGYTTTAARGLQAIRQRPPAEQRRGSNQPPDQIAALTSRVDTLENELAALRAKDKPLSPAAPRGRESKPLSPAQRVASRSGRRSPRNLRGSQ